MFFYRFLLRVTTVARYMLWSCKKVYASVLFVCRSQTGVLAKQINARVSRKERHTIAFRLVVCSHYMIPQTFTATSEHIRFYFLFFSVFTLFGCCFRAVD